MAQLHAPILIASIGIVLSACTTPVIMLKNEQTGQVARCGGNSSGFMAAGLIGRTIQQHDDQECVRDFEAQGFRRIE